MEQYSTKRLGLCLYKVDIPKTRSTFSETERSCARTRPWGQSSHPHHPVLPWKPSIASSIPRDQRRTRTRTWRRRRKRKRKKIERTVSESICPRLPIATVTPSFVVSIQLSKVTWPPMKHVCTQTEPVFVGNYEEVREMVRMELSRTLRSLADQLLDTKQEIDKLQKEKERLDILIRTKNSPSLVDSQPVSKGCGISKDTDTSARTRPYCYVRHDNTTTTVSNPRGNCDNQSSTSRVVNETIVRCHGSLTLDTSCKQPETELPRLVSCDTELVVETINSKLETNRLVQRLHELCSYLRVPSHDSALNGLVTSLREPLELLANCLKQNSFPLTPITSLLEHTIELFKKCNCEPVVLSASAPVVDSQSAQLICQLLLEEVLQLVHINYD